MATLPNAGVAGSLGGHEPATGRSAVGSGKGEAAAVRQCADAAEGLSGPRSALNRHIGSQGEISTGFLPSYSSRTIHEPEPNSRSTFIRGGVAANCLLRVVAPMPARSRLDRMAGRFAQPFAPVWDRRQC